ncbi:MAG TPA: hypothetical protein V6C64_16130 [Microcoleaceae cyanobacterium]|jgi:bacterioferritin-associated ferredoxin
MPNHPLFSPVHEQVRTTNIRDQIQIALAIADSSMLTSLLATCIPAIFTPETVGLVASEVSVPTDHQQAADGVLHVETIQCVLADSQPQLESPANRGMNDSRELARLTQHESEMHLLGQNLTLATAIALLETSGFTSEQIDQMLRLSPDAWYKSWWYAIDPNGAFTLPFLRCIRTRHHIDGTLTIQYKDYFEQTKPACFTSLSERVLIAIRAEQQSFGETLQQINYQRRALNIQRAILICHTISELEAQAFIRQGISVYPAIDLVLPVQSNCVHCGRYECPMNGTADSPVALCHGFLLASEYV